MSDNRTEEKSELPPRYMTIPAYARYLSLSESAVKRLIKKGVLIVKHPTSRPLLRRKTNDARFDKYCDLIEEERKRANGETA